MPSKIVFLIAVYYHMEFNSFDNLLKNHNNSPPVTKSLTRNFYVNCDHNFFCMSDHRLCSDSEDPFQSMVLRSASLSKLILKETNKGNNFVDCNKLWTLCPFMHCFNG